MNDTVTLSAIDVHVMLATLNRPEASNALNTRMAEALSAVFAGIAWTSGERDVRAVILTGAGDRAFCAGADLKERRGVAADVWRQQHTMFEQALAALAGCPVPVIAAVNGAALGGGNEIALACDLIVAAETATFGQPEVARGIMPGLGGTQRLPRRIGAARAKDLLFTGRVIGAREALAWGLVNEVVPPEAVIPRALDIGRSIAAGAPAAVRHVKAAVDEGLALPLDDALACELAHYRAVVGTEDRLEGIAAFNEKRPPTFRGR